MAGRRKAIMAWSSGKDSAYALHLVRQQGDFDVVALLTTIDGSARRIAMHGVPKALLDRQAVAVGLPLRKIAIPNPCPNALYEQTMAAAMNAAKAEGIEAIIFGDLFLEDIRTYREAMLRPTGLEPVFPLWQRETGSLADEMLQAGLQATIAAVDLRRLNRGQAGRRFDAAFLASLPAGIDPCGENGEFHTFVTAGPMFAHAVPVQVGPVTDRDGLAQADLLPAAA